MFSRSQLTHLIVPLMIQQILVMLVGMLDTVMVSYAGEAAISGVSLVNEVNYLIIAVFDALGAGGSVVIAQYLGNRDKKNADVSASQLVMISILVPLVLGILCFVFCRQILSALYGQINSDVMEAAVTYFWITAISFPFLGLYDSCNALFRSMSRTKEIMYTSILMNIINVIGNYIGVYILHLGAAGVAWPTVLSRAVAALIMMKMSLHEENEVSVEMDDVFAWKPAVLKKILQIAVPNALENGLFQLGRVIVTIFVATYGTVQIAANGVANGLGNLTYIGDNALGLAIMTVVGQCVGANDYEQARKYAVKLTVISQIIEAVECVIVYFTLPWTMQMYTMTAETQAVVRQILVWNCLTTGLIHSTAFVLPNALRAAGDVRYTMIVGVASMFCVRITGAWLMGSMLGLHSMGVWFAMYCDWVVRILFFVHRFRSGKWKNYRIIEAA